MTFEVLEIFHHESRRYELSMAKAQSGKVGSFEGHMDRHPHHDKDVIDIESVHESADSRLIESMNHSMMASAMLVRQ